MLSLDFKKVSGELTLHYFHELVPFHDLLWEPYFARTCSKFTNFVPTKIDSKKV